MAGCTRTGQWLAICLPLLLCLLLVGSDAKSSKDKKTEHYTADLRGESIVPPINTPGHGTADFTVHRHSKAKDSVCSYNITLFEVSEVKSVELHQAPVGQPGDLVAFLYGPMDNPLNQTVNGLLKAGDLTRNDLTGPLKGKDINDLQTRADNHDIYVLVTTVMHPNGELRGEMEKS